MANKRDLKRTVNEISQELLAECVAASLYNGKPAKGDVDALLSSIILMRNDFVSRISHPEPGMKAREYFDNLAHQFSKQVCEISDQIHNLSE